MRNTDYPQLRTRATQSPWRELANAAITYAEQESFDPNAGDYDAKTRMTELCGSLGLAYVLEQKTATVSKLKATLDHWPDYYRPTAASGSVTQIRWQQSAMIQCLFALDVMRPALTPSDRLHYETMIDTMVQTWWDNLSQDGTASTPG